MSEEHIIFLPEGPIKVSEISETDKSTLAPKCSGNACKDIKIRWSNRDDEYKIYNDGDQDIEVKVNEMPTRRHIYCGVIKTYFVRSGDWESMDGIGYCSYQANYD